MIITCKLEKCPYYNNGLCSNIYLSINESGQCEQIWQKGQIRFDAFYPVPDYLKTEIVVIEQEDSLSATGDNTCKNEEFNAHTEEEETIDHVSI